MLRSHQKPSAGCEWTWRIAAARKANFGSSNANFVSLWKSSNFIHRCAFWQPINLDCLIRLGDTLSVLTEWRTFNTRSAQLECHPLIAHLFFFLFFFSISNCLKPIFENTQGFVGFDAELCLLLIANTWKVKTGIFWVKRKGSKQTFMLFWGYVAFDVKPAKDIFLFATARTATFALSEQNKVKTVRFSVSRRDVCDVGSA